MKVKIRVTKSLYVATIFAAVIVTANAGRMAYEDYTTGTMNVTRDSLWCVGALILWFSVRTVRFMRTVGYHPGFHRR